MLNVEPLHSGWARTQRTGWVTWRRWFDSADRVVARTKVVVSMVFAGLGLGCGSKQAHGLPN
jgi:hypothetical protein